MTDRPPPANLRRLDRTFLHDLLAQLDGYERDRRQETPTQYLHFRRFLGEEWLKRILFDARQAETFAGLMAAPSERISRQLRLPFPAFYLEFSEPVGLSADWQVDPNEYLRAVIVGGSQPIRVWQPPGRPGEAASYRTVRPLHIAAFITDAGTTTFTDRMWRMDLQTGEALVQRATCDTLSERIYLSDGTGLESRVVDPATDASTGLEAMALEDFFPAGFHAEERVVGWWERAALAGSALLQWCIAYMMAKSVILEVEQPYASRQTRRWSQRHGKPLPKPWHVVKVDPRYRRGQESENPGGSHGYMYDVMGHIRVNRHRVGSKRPDGTYAMQETLEWVPDHVRGLANDLYIPATRVVRAGRKVPPGLRGGQG